MNNLKEGMEIHTVYVTNDIFYEISLNCYSITVSMEAGQYGLVPWFVVNELDGDEKVVPYRMFNADACIGVDLVKN